MHEKTCICIEKRLEFEKRNEVLSVKISLENVSPEIKAETIKPFLEILFSKACDDLKLNNS